ncbi:hypothetical protein KJ596_03340 [Patescibacteria group bacterium]|nr:hypothetical protein [Patescibacteria group bacterium]MBU1867923.1 hypothetical protein [Patescibacteria group bacterium]
MKVFFSCTTKGIIEHKDSYLSIRDSIKQQGHTLTRDWLDTSIEYVNKNQSDTPSSELYSDVIAAILSADAVVLEGTVPSMSIGHQLSVALHKGKHVLLLTKRSSKKLKDFFIVGAESPLLTVKTYNIDSLTLILTDFFADINGGTKARFNLVMNKHQDNYVEWAAFTYKKSKTEIIKDSINKQISHDTRYQEYKT